MLATNRVLLIFLALCFMANLGFAQSRTIKIAPRWGSYPVKKKNGAPLTATVVQEGLIASNAEPLDMWGSYFVYKETDDECFLGRPSDRDLRLQERLGWVEKKYILTSPEALRTDNKIFRKVIVFDNKYENRIPVFSSARGDAEEIGKTPMFSFFYVFKEVEDFYLIGLAPEVDMSYLEEEILGWIHKKSCREWNTRQAVGYDLKHRYKRIRQFKYEKFGLAQIFKSFDDAKANNQENIIAQEEAQVEWRYNMPRYPLIESKAVDQKRIFQLAFLSGGKSSVIQQIISRMKDARDKLKKIDLMFVIDSSSERDHRQQIMDAISEVIEKVQKDHGDFDIELGLTFYSDFSKWRPYAYQRGRIFQPRVVRLCRFSGLRGFIRDIENQHFYGLIEESKSLYYGIDSSMNERNRWREGSSRFIFVMGFSGNHEGNSETDVSQLTIDDLKDPLESNRVRIYSVQIPHKKSDAPHSEAYNRQMATLAEKNNGLAFSAKDVQEKDGKQHLVNVLSMLMEQSINEVKVLQQAVADLEHGVGLEEISKRYEPRWQESCDEVAKTCTKIFGMGPVNKQKYNLFFPKVTDIVKGFTRIENIPIEDLQASDVFYDQGWAWEFHPVSDIKQMQVFLLMNKVELSRLIGFLSALQVELQRASKPEQYLEIWKTLLKTTFGIDTIPASEPLDNLIQQHTGLPFVNGLLSYSLEDFVRESRQPTFRQDLLNKIQETTNLLFDVLSEKEIERLYQPDGSYTLEKKKRWWREGSSEEYAWVEVELFP